MTNNKFKRKSKNTVLSDMRPIPGTKMLLCMVRDRVKIRYVDRN